MQQMRKTWLSAGAIPVVAIVLVLRLALIGSRDGIAGVVGALVFLVVVLGVFFGGYFAYIKTLSVTVEGGAVVRRALGRTRRIPAGVLQRVIMASYTQRTRYTTREYSLVAFVDGSGRSLLTLGQHIWAESDAHALISQLGLASQVISLGHQEKKQLREKVPGALPWTVAHPVSTVFIALGVVVAVIILVVVIAVLAGS